MELVLGCWGGKCFIAHGRIFKVLGINSFLIRSLSFHNPFPMLPRSPMSLQGFHAQSKCYERILLKYIGSLNFRFTSGFIHAIWLAVKLRTSRFSYLNFLLMKNNYRKDKRNRFTFLRMRDLWFQITYAFICYRSENIQ